MALSPWPTSPVALATATAALRAATGIGDDATAKRLGAVAAARVENYAPMAPQAIKDEAVIRFAGYLRHQPSVIRTLAAGSVQLDYAVSGFVRPFVNCGSKGLLSPFVRRRALPAVSSA